MAMNRKKTQPLSNDYGWGDSFSVSKKARQEMAEISSNKEEYQNKYLEEKTKVKTTKLSYPPKKNKTEIQKELDSQLENINKEFGKALDEVETMLGKFLDQVLYALKNLGLVLKNIALKIALFVFVEPLKNMGKFMALFINLLSDSLNDFNNWLETKNTSKKLIESTKEIVKDSANINPLTNQPYSTIPSMKSQEEIMKNKYPHVFDGIVFGELAKKGIIFLDIKNNPLYDDFPKEFSPEEENNLLEKALKEISRCAPLAKNLPSPTKGRYYNKPMTDILEKIQMEDLKMFLQYVYTHPKPFIERKLRLSEAFATWAHKGAPV